MSAPHGYAVARTGAGDDAAGVAPSVTRPAGRATAVPQPSASLEEPTHDDQPGTSRWRHRPWRAVRAALSPALLGAAAYFLVGKAHELQGAWHMLGHLRWRWVGLAVVFEAASMVVFARMQRWLLRAGGVEVPLRTMVEITVAGNAMAATLPGGVAWAGAWVFGQLRRRGVSRFLRIWMFLVAGAVSSFALFVVLAVGIELAGATGPVAGLRWAALGLAALPVAAVGLLVARHTGPAQWLRRTAATASSGVPGGQWLLGAAGSLARRVRAVRLRPLGWFEVLALGLLNWLDDCGVLVACLLALHVAVPWRGVFVVYGLTQVAASLPVTPGGLGVVEGTLVTLLHAYGVPVPQAFAAAVVYRIVSFWGLVPVGWGVWVTLDVLEQRGRRAGRPHPWARHGDAVVPSAPARRRALPEPRPCPACTGERDVQGQQRDEQTSV